MPVYIYRIMNNEQHRRRRSLLTFSNNARWPRDSRLGGRRFRHHVDGPAKQLCSHEIAGRRIQILASTVITLYIAIQIGAVQRQCNHHQQLCAKNWDESRCGHSQNVDNFHLTHQPLELQPKQCDHEKHRPQHRAQDQRQPKDACLLRIDATLQFVLTQN